MLVVDDHDVVHWGFRLLLAEQPWVKRCLTARDHDEAMALTARYEPDVALVDLFLGEHSGAELCTSITTEHPSHARAADLRRRLDLAPGGPGGGRVGLRVQGLQRRRGDRRGQAVGAGNLVFPRSPREPSAPLSPREREVLALMAGGSTNREIAAQLHLSPHTVKEHTSTLYRKLDVRNRAEAVRRAERLGLSG